MSDETLIQQCYSTWSDNYYREYYGDSAPYPPVHTKIIRELLVSHGSHRLLDVGCGPASILRDLQDLKLERYGFDLTPEMVQEAERVLVEQGEPPGRVWQGSILNAESFSVKHLADAAPKDFDAVLCVGVMPHIPEQSDTVAFDNIRSALRAGGVAIVEARNQLFSLFSANRYSYEFFTNELINVSALRQRLPEDSVSTFDFAIEQLKSNFRVDLPHARPGKGGQPGYDEVLSRSHNPLVLQEQFRKAGFAKVETLFYHYHALPPYLGRELGQEFVRQSVLMENPRDWRGLFMASAFFLVGVAE